MRKSILLLVEDEDAIRDMIRFSFQSHPFVIIDAKNASQAMFILNETTPDLIILDWVLPGKSGIDIIKMLKQNDSFKNIPIIMLTAKAEEDNKIKGLMSGADDFVTKPFSPKELIARIQAVLRRGPLISPSGEIKVDDLVLNTYQCKVQVKDTLIKLTPLEYKMLYFFMKHPNKAFNRDQLITHVWGSNFYIGDRTIDVQIRRLRDKLRPHGHDSRIRTVRNMGYLFVSSTNEH